MAMVGIASRVPRVMFVHPVAARRLLPCYAADKSSCLTKKYLTSLARTTWTKGSADSMFGTHVCLEPQRIGKSVFRALPNRFFVRALDVSGPGSVDSPLMKTMQSKIQKDLNAESVSVTDAYGDGRHVSIDVVASTFEGKSAVNRQRLVYKAIWEELQEKVHAVDQLKTRTPAEAAKSPGQL